MNLRQALFDLLCFVQSLRSSHQGLERDPIDNLSVPAWVLVERRAVHEKVNEIRASKGLVPIDEATLGLKIAPI